MVQRRKPTKNDLRIEFHSLGGLPVDFNPKWTRAEVLETVEELQKRKWEKMLKEAGDSSHSFQPAPKAPPTLIDRILDRSGQAFAFVYGLLLVFVVLDWIGFNLLGGGFFSGLTFLVLVILPAVILIGDR